MKEWTKLSEIFSFSRMLWDNILQDLMLAEQKRQFTSMSEEQQEADPVGEKSSIDKVNICVATKLLNHVQEGWTCGRKERWGFWNQKRDKVRQLLRSQLILICTFCRSRSRSKVPEGKRRNIRRLILQFLQFFRPGKVEPFQIWTRPTPYMSMLTKKETFHFVGLLDFQYLLLLWPSLEDALGMCNKTSFIAEKRTVLCNKHFHCVLFIAQNQTLKRGSVQWSIIAQNQSVQCSHASQWNVMQLDGEPFA